MASLFDPLSVALETVKTIEGVGSHRLDPPRFRVRVPVNPGEWAKKEAFQRQHDLRKWNMFHSKVLARAEKKGLKLPKVAAIVRVSVSSVAESLKEGEEAALEEAKDEIGSKPEESSDVVAAGRPDEDEDYEAEYIEEDEDEEAQRIAKMSSNQIRYYNACMKFKVTVNRKVLRCIDHYELVLSLMKMTDPEFKAIMTALVANDTIERLDLTELRFTDQQMVYLTDFFTEDNAVTDLILANNNLRGKIMVGLFSALSARNSLVYLDITGNDLRDKDAPMIAEFVKTSESLMYLYMSRNNFTEKSGDIFGKMMGDNTSLVDLDISANRIRCLGAEKFIKGFSKNGFVERLNFSWNGLGKEGVKAMVNLLKKNSTLLYLNLAGNRITGTDLEQFYPALKKNSTLRRIVLSHNPFLMSDITSFLKELYKWTGCGLQRVDFGDYQVVETAATPLIDLLFWEKNIDVRYGGPLTHSQTTEKCEELTAKFKDDPLALVSHLTSEERMKLVKYFGQLDLTKAIEEGEDEISVESFLHKVRNNKVTYRDLANRVKRQGKNSFDVINEALEQADLTVPANRYVPRYSIHPGIARKLQLRTRAEEMGD